MQTSIATPNLPVVDDFHPVYQQFLSNGMKEYHGFRWAIANHAVGRAIVLAATGAKELWIRMPTMQDAPRCTSQSPATAWLIEDGWLFHMKRHPARFLDNICYQLGGVGAEFVFGDGDNYGELGQGDVEDTFKYLAAFKAAHGVATQTVLAGCFHVTSCILGQYHDLAEKMVQQLLKHGNLCRHDMNNYLPLVREEEVGEQVLATFNEPWIEEEAERVHRLLIGS
jgi:hypothetical protein